VSPGGGAAAELGISRQVVHRAIARGTLDVWFVSETGEEHDSALLPVCHGRVHKALQTKWSPSSVST
jgi:hypothetical protein